MQNAQVEQVLSRFFPLAERLAQRGWLWISAGGGTINAVADELASLAGLDFEEAMALVEETGTEWYQWDWRQALFSAQPEFIDADVEPVDVRCLVHKLWERAA